MSEGFLPPNPALDPPAAAPYGVPTGQRDQVIVDIPVRSDPRELKRLGVDAQEYDMAEVDAFNDVGHAAPFDQDAYDRAQAEAGNPAADGLTVDSETTLSAEERTDLGNLITVGKRKGHVVILGHRVDVQTLNAQDEMNVGRYVKPYMDSPGFVRAWTVATAAAGVRLIDNQRIYDALAPIEDEAELFDQKVRIMARHYPYVITPVYDEIQRLDGEFAELAEKLGKRHG